MSLEVKQLSKNYKDQKALDGVSFSASSGQILGFLGPNGAGKSTTMKIAAGYLLPDHGDVLVNGISVIEHPQHVSRQIGYLPEHNPLYLEMYIKEFLTFMAGIYGVKGVMAKRRVQEVIASCGLETEKHKKIGALSKGYRQRVGLAKALVHDPNVIILDEPTTGLDPNQLVEIRKLIKSISLEKTLILSTHIMQEVEAMCDRVVIIHQGKVMVQDSLENLKSSNGQVSIYLETQENLETDWFTSLQGVNEVRVLAVGSIQLLTNEPTSLRKNILEVINEKQLSLLSLRQEERNLETIFHQLTSAAV
ncbi:gliding motility-associated ABC transporter ATP-binding subunit GldA [Echinicola sp. CAU 1574]|uniref:Gliding motility-associated ABC transporter ATP-binding subunit GldA n=1 Tax=Echinicola arenosa TaxID=2774144 RepID=A0ABR9AQR2_9BACT|nr:gliding motility-associated ABC transporter ATP-binding subunit GldA [Echinicola arenosa]MBD8490218.1 gliding motility-associated ABC transporter ATP-binding subunit GldA [Echinicola arenosa]